MRICFVGQSSVQAYLQSAEMEEVARTKIEGKDDLTVFGFENGEISYERELKGDTCFFENVAQLSKKKGGLVVCGVATNTHGHRRKSAVVAENGRILGVSDMLHALDGDGHSGAFLRVYETKIGRVGVAVAEDIYFPETVSTLAVCGCAFIVCPFAMVEDHVCSVLLRAHAFTGGVPIVFCGKGYAMIADVDGTLAFASPISPVCADFAIRKEFHLLELRRKIYLKGK